MELLSETQLVCSYCDWLSNAVIAAVLLLLYVIYYFYFQKKKDSFIQYVRLILLPYTVASGLGIYFIGYQFGNSEHCLWWRVIPNILESIFSTTRLFILGNDFVELEAPFKHGAIFNAMFALTASLAAFIFVSFMAQVFFKIGLLSGRSEEK